jgi:ankyrin repeat protein
MDLPLPRDCRVSLSLFEKKIRASVRLQTFHWSVMLKADLDQFVGHFEQVTIKPSFKAATTTTLFREKNRTSVQLLGGHVPCLPGERGSSAGEVASMAFCDSRQYGPAFKEVAYTLCLLFDLSYAPNLSILFDGLRPLQITNFRRAILLNSEELLRIQLTNFGVFVALSRLPDNTPFLHYAALVSHNPTLFRLICEPCDLSAVDDEINGRTAVFYALRNKHIAILQVLIDCKADIDRCDAAGKTPLIWCLESGDWQRAQFLLDNGACVHRTFSKKYVSALSYAIERKSVNMVRLLLPYAGNEINCPDSNGLFPLHLCLQNGFSEGILLIDQLCPLFNVNLFATPVPHALHFLMQERRLNQTCRPPILPALLSIKRLDLNVYNTDGYTPLLVALMDDTMARADTVVDLLAGDPRCDVNAPSREGVTPLFLAVSKNRISMTRALIGHGAFSNQPNSNGMTPIMAAIQQGNVELLSLLLTSGADPDQWIFNRKVPLDFDGLSPDVREQLVIWSRKCSPVRA